MSSDIWFVEFIEYVMARYGAKHKGTQKGDDEIHHGRCCCKLKHNHIEKFVEFKMINNSTY